MSMVQGGDSETYQNDYTGMPRMMLKVTQTLRKALILLTLRVTISCLLVPGREEATQP